MTEQSKPRSQIIVGPAVPQGERRFIFYTSSSSYFRSVTSRFVENAIRNEAPIATERKQQINVVGGVMMD